MLLEDPKNHLRQALDPVTADRLCLVNSYEMGFTDNAT